MIFASIVLAASEESSGTDLLLPDFRELGAAIVAFAVVFFFIWKYAIPAFNETLEKRAAAVKAELESAEAAKIEAESLKNDYQAQLAQARDEASRIVEEARQAGESVRAEVVSRAESEASAIKLRATADISGERERVAAALKRDVADLSLDVAEKVLGSSLDRRAQQALVDGYIDELGGLGS
jgi:F-type H+-transporting ATPase subunit b